MHFWLNTEALTLFEVSSLADLDYTRNLEQE